MDDVELPKLTGDQQIVLDLVADLALQGFHGVKLIVCAQLLDWTEERTRQTLSELVELGMVSKNSSPEKSS